MEGLGFKRNIEKHDKACQFPVVMSVTVKHSLPFFVYFFLLGPQTIILIPCYKSGVELGMGLGEG